MAHTMEITLAVMMKSRKMHRVESKRATARIPISSSPTSKPIMDLNIAKIEATIAVGKAICEMIGGASV